MPWTSRRWRICLNEGRARCMPRLMPPRVSIIILVAVATGVLSSCQESPQKATAESGTARPAPATPAPARQSARIGEWHVDADAVDYSQDGSKATFKGRVRLGTRSDEYASISDATDDPESFAVFDLASGSLVERKGRFQSSRALGLAPSRP